MPASTPSVSRSLCPTTRKYTASVDPPRQRVIGFRALSKGIRRARRLVLNAAAKVNLILEVLGKRDDGYHELVTVMQAVDLSDRITLEDAEVLELASSPGVPADGRNLALRAATALREAAGVTRGARITLDKRIPVAAGLGGGRVAADRADAGGAAGGRRAGRADVGQRADGVRRRALVRARAADPPAADAGRLGLLGGPHADGTGDKDGAVTMFLGRGQAARRGTLDPVFGGSNPPAPTTLTARRRCPTT